MPSGDPHQVIQPRVLYFGTPVVLISTINEDGSPNLAPMSSAWWLGSSVMLGLDETSQTTLNLRRTGELVLNLPDSTMAAPVDRLAGYTGTPVVPRHKAEKGYEYRADKFGTAELTPIPSAEVAPPRVQECPIQLEALVDEVRPFSGAESGVVAVDARVVRTHVRPELLVPGSTRHIDPDRWDPLIMKFTHFYGGGRNLQSSRLAQAWKVPRLSPETDGHDNWNWNPTEFAGVEATSALTGAEVTCWRMSRGASFDDHVHARDEAIVVVEGELRFTDGTWARPGDVVHARRGDTHGATALVDSLFYVIESPISDPERPQPARVREEPTIAVPVR